MPGGLSGALRRNLAPLAGRIRARSLLSNSTNSEDRMSGDAASGNDTDDTGPPGTKRRKVLLLGSDGNETGVAPGHDQRKDVVDGKVDHDDSENLAVVGDHLKPKAVKTRPTLCTLPEVISDIIYRFLPDKDQKSLKLVQMEHDAPLFVRVFKKTIKPNFTSVQHLSKAGLLLCRWAVKLHWDDEFDFYGPMSARTSAQDVCCDYRKIREGEERRIGGPRFKTESRHGVLRHDPPVRVEVGDKLSHFLTSMPLDHEGYLKYQNPRDFASYVQAHCELRPLAEDFYLDADPVKSAKGSALAELNENMLKMIGLGHNKAPDNPPPSTTCFAILFRHFPDILLDRLQDPAFPRELVNVHYSLPSTLGIVIHWPSTDSGLGHRLERNESTWVPRGDSLPSPDADGFCNLSACQKRVLREVIEKFELSRDMVNCVGEHVVHETDHHVASHNRIFSAQSPHHIVEWRVSIKFRRTMLLMLLRNDMEEDAETFLEKHGAKLDLDVITGSSRMEAGEHLCNPHGNCLAWRHNPHSGSVLATDTPISIAKNKNFVKVAALLEQLKAEKEADAGRRRQGW